MVKKLTFLLRQTAWRLAFKSLLATAALFLVYLSRFNGWSVFLFLVAVLWIYLGEITERRRFRFSFWLLIFIAFLMLKSAVSFSFLELPIITFTIFGTFLLFGALFFTILGLANFFFKNQNLVYRLWNTVIIFLITLFYQNISVIFLFLAVMLIFKEIFEFFGFSPTKRVFIFSLAAAFLALEVSLFISFLPLGFVNAAAVLTLFLFLLRDAFLAFFEGRLNLSVVFYEITLFMLFLLIIFATVSWVI